MYFHSSSSKGYLFLIHLLSCSVFSDIPVMRSNRYDNLDILLIVFTIRGEKNKSREAIMVRNENDISYRSDVFKRNCLTDWINFQQIYCTETKAIKLRII